MIRFAFMLACAASLLSASVSIPALAEEDTEMIVGGKKVPDGKYPYQVRLYGSMEDDKGFCGGSIIAPQWILTAGHCVVADAAEGQEVDELQPVDKVYVGYGSTNRTKTTKIESEKIVVHPLYLKHGLTGGGDVALVKLKQPIADAKPVEYANEDTEKKFMTRGAKVTVTGWGAIWDPEDQEVVELLAKINPQTDITERLNFPTDLYETDINVMGRDECRAIYTPHQLKIADSEICAMKPRSASNSCYGDSGGPLVLRAEDPKRYVQIGVVSWGDRCGRAGSPNVFARVASFSDWIEETMTANAGSASEPAPPESIEIIVTKPTPPESADETLPGASDVPAMSSE